MTDNWYPVDDPTAIEREPRKCRRHVWVHKGGPGVVPEWDGTTRCLRCDKVRDEAAVRRGRTSRNRGNAYEREVAAKLGGRRVGQYGDKVDVEVPGWLRVQTKNGTAYPARIDGWLRAIPAQADLLRAVVIGDAPGPGGKRRSLIILDLDEFCAFYGKG